jgi:hypothetical protein
LSITLYYKQIAFHCPEWMEEHGTLNLFNAQGLEHSNTETKQGLRKPTNRQRQRLTQKRGLTLSSKGGAEHELFSAAASPHGNTRANKRQWQQVNNAVATPRAV